MYSQSLVAQLCRWFALLVVVIIAVHQCEPLQRALAEYAVEGGCHQQHSSAPSSQL